MVPVGLKPTTSPTVDKSALTARSPVTGSMGMRILVPHSGIPLPGTLACAQ